MRGLTLTDGRIELRDRDRAFRLQVDELTLAPGQAVALTGASGSGKTLLLELLGLLRAPGKGTVFLCDGKNLATLWGRGVRDADLARMRGQLFGFVPQTGALMPFLSVTENIALPQHVTGREDAAWCTALIDRLGIGDVASLMPGALSIGQRQRVAIARALAHRPPFVIADEPTAALDSDSADVVLDLLLAAAKEQDSGVILSSHDTDRVARFGIPRLALTTESQNGVVTSRLEPAPC
ncbi:ABC transporter ATP-binding protein [Sedimentitalea todarodis]|uniref:ATP-binding cassette domain-containing protein n=1 Tax=Sedimentitalea todarodis TaxID=1631240 RepID=A0ABU3VB28_9RHOB|nr:ATP-binding cassette domain-containing protein [Sedimentitalea todarodis]MDU9003378.1 ATP-binding cassette domain-containing protein [Sedimentitalea todarodis]